MQSKATTVKQYLLESPEDQKAPLCQLRQVILDHLPAGFEECMNYGMIGYVVPHSLYPAGYHCDTNLPLPFLNIACQKNSINLYHMGMYAKPALKEWFISEYQKISKRKIDAGKSCTRFKYYDEIPFELIGQLVEKMSVDEWVSLYENSYKKR